MNEMSTSMDGYIVSKREREERKRQEGEMKPPYNEVFRWVIVGTYGLYTGQWLTRDAAIEYHVRGKGKTWARCRQAGDRAVKAQIRWPHIADYAPDVCV